MAQASGWGREGQTWAGGSLLARYASFVKLPHTLFALPFAGVGVVLASYEHASRISPARLFWVLLAFTAARFAAMGFNRIVDRRLDALNPRTRARELPAGRLTLGQAAAATAAAAVLFVGAAWMLNPLCGMLAPIALAWVFFYSYTKRFTAWSHHVLGLALGIAPVGAYLALAGAWREPWYALPLLAAGVMFWVAGFDMIYALQDESFDRAQGLHSVPARRGSARTLLLARISHVLSLAAFTLLVVLDLFPVGALFGGGLIVMAGLLAWEHRIVREATRGPLDVARIDRAFFALNVAVSLALFVFALLDRLIAPDVVAGIMIVVPWTTR
jgi:4-hydroxybenzoate polyprenyltransferase